MSGVEKKRSGSPAARFAFLLYCGVMLWLLFGQRLQEDLAQTPLQQQGLNINLIPLHTLKQYWGLLRSDNAYYVHHALINLAGNVVMFVPLGMLLPGIFPGLRRLWRVMLCTLTIMVAVELTQYLTHLGSCDVDDLILNLLGALLGYWLWKLGSLIARKIHT